MKIMSLNVNSFMGTDTKDVDGIIKWSPEYEGLRFSERIKDFDIQNKSQIAIDGIIEIIKVENPEIIIFQEYRRNFPSAIAFEQHISNIGYKGPLTHQQKAPDKFGFSTAFFVKEEFKYIDEMEIYDRLTFSRCDDRVYSIKALGIVIAGVHIPLNSGTGNRSGIREETWDDLIKYFKKNSRETILAIGDFNTYDSNGENKEAYELKRQFLDNCAIDLWDELKNKKDDTPTQKPYMARLDYAFIKKGTDQNINIRLIPEEDDDFKKNWELSDHRMIIVEFEDKMKYDYQLPEKRLSIALSKMFPNGGETYTSEDVKRIFEEEGVDITDFDDLMARCVREGWITDCGGNNYSR